MKYLTQSARNKKKEFTPTKPGVFEEFILWSALPENDRIHIGIEQQKDFAEYYKVGQDTLSRWKSLEEYRKRVRYLRDQWAFNRTGTVIASIYRSAVKGNDKSQKLWMQLFENFTEKTEVAQTEKVEVGENDIRFIINGLPEPYRTKFNEYITEIIITANQIKSARTADDVRWDDQRPENDISNGSSIDAPDISNEVRVDDVAQSYKGGVQTDMVGVIS